MLLIEYMFQYDLYILEFLYLFSFHAEIFNNIIPQIQILQSKYRISVT